jgi:hypothetical protein
MSILKHAIWPQLRPWIVIGTYGRDGGSETPRHRIELRTPPKALLETFLAVEAPCVSCGTPSHPIRRRGSSGGVYYAAACPLSVSIKCSRCIAAAMEYTDVARAMGVEE